MKVIVVVLAAIFVPTALCLVGTMISMRIVSKAKNTDKNESNSK